jgi:hypothetical protein
MNWKESGRIDNEVIKETNQEFVWETEEKYANLSTDNGFQAPDLNTEIPGQESQ